MNESSPNPCGEPGGQARDDEHTIDAHALAHGRELQRALRHDPSRVPAFADEAMRVRGPLVANRRVAKRSAVLGNQEIEAGDRLRILWPAANRDERTFDEPATVRVERDPEDNLLYGAGIHVCPGAPLARLELRVMVEELLARTREIRPHPEREAVFAEPPKGGFERVPVVLEARQSSAEADDG